MKSGYMEASGARLYYEEAGEGPALVLIHAGIADRRMWDEQFGPFAERFRVVRYDRRGFGRTRMVAGRYTNHGDLRELMRGLGLERAALVGCSQGAKAAVDFALAWPEMTTALVLVAPALSGFAVDFEPPPQQRELEQAAEAGDLARVNELELQIWVDGPSRVPGEVDPRVRALVGEMNRIALATPEDLGVEEAPARPAAGHLSEIELPALVVVGDLDTPKTLAAAEHLAQGIKGARRIFIEGTAHLPNMERPAEFNRHVLSFLADLELSPSPSRAARAEELS
jgi:pimeloyl-ACP methyl ester carboxylesterase